MGMYAEFQGKEFKAYGLLWTCIEKAGIVYHDDGFLEVPSDKISLVARHMYEEITSPKYMESIKSDGTYASLYRLKGDVDTMVALYQEDKEQNISKQFCNLLFS